MLHIDPNDPHKDITPDIYKAALTRSLALFAKNTICTICGYPHRILPESISLAAAASNLFETYLADTELGLSRSLSDADKDKFLDSIVTVYNSTGDLAIAQDCGQFCYTCGTEAKHLCGGCAAVWYCDKECQKSHWPVHKATCKALKEHNKKQPSSQLNDPNHG
jgi:hypothetical protein